MSHLQLTTFVEQNYIQVAQQFDQNLFQKLLPPFPKVKVLRYDGSRTGDEVHVEMNFLLFKQVWKSLITENWKQNGQIYFVDEGTQLPFFLKYWRHRHVIQQEATGSRIIDDVTFRSPFRLLDFFLYPVMYLQFALRKPLYRKYFAQSRSSL
jgi:ligand-binding SRPBCC domain-containing protein